MLNRISISTHSQLPLVHVVNEDDELLSNNCDAQWYSILKKFPWENYRELGASYYNALYDFNISKQLKGEDSKENKETKDAGRQRLLLFDLPADKRHKVIFIKRDLDEILASQKAEMFHRMIRECT